MRGLVNRGKQTGSSLSLMIHFSLVRCGGNLIVLDGIMLVLYPLDITRQFTPTGREFQKCVSRLPILGFLGCNVTFHCFGPKPFLSLSHAKQTKENSACSELAMCIHPRTSSGS